MICKYCNIETNLSGGAHSNHVGWCKSNPKRAERVAALIKRGHMNFLEEGKKRWYEEQNQQKQKCISEGRKFFILSEETREKLRIAGTGRKCPHTEETKKKLSLSRKKWLEENPDRHPWKHNDKFKSVPCETLKERIRSEGFIFEEEFSPLEKRWFSVDIAFPDVKLAIEVNGEQHYNRDGTLGDYYEERHQLIEKSGWHVLELHYARCCGSKLDETIDSIKKLLSDLQIRTCNSEERISDF